MSRFFVVPGFSMLALSAAIEPLRSANRQLAARRYEWSVVAREPGPVAAGNGLELTAAHGVAAAPAPISRWRSRASMSRTTATGVFDWFRRLQGRDG